MGGFVMASLLVMTACSGAGSTTGPETVISQTTERPTTSSTESTTTTVQPTTTTAPPTQTEALLASIKAAEAPGPVKVGLVAHKASVLPEGRTIDVIANDPSLELVRIFAPEHGLAGEADAGQLVEDGTEPTTGVPVVSLYGTTRSPAPAQLDDLDVIVYDLQDVGVRAYTYIATMGLVMDAAAGSDVPVIVVDRPNPQGDTITGPSLSPGLSSFISPYDIPAVYGLTSGELASMLVGEGLVEASDLVVVGPSGPLPDPWIPPSPNLPTLESTWLYPAVVAFEATSLSEGRGTDTPFSLVGGPGADIQGVLATTGGRQLIGLDIVPTEFTPQDIPNMAVNPRFEGETIPGIKLTTNGALDDPFRVTVELLDAFMDTVDNRSAIIDRPDVFDRLVGDPAVRIALIGDLPPAEIVELWTDDVADFRLTADRYRMN